MYVLLMFGLSIAVALKLFILYTHCSLLCYLFSRRHEVPPDAISQLATLFLLTLSTITAISLYMDIVSTVQYYYGVVFP